MKKHALIAAMLLLCIVAGCGGSPRSSSAPAAGKYGGDTAADAGWAEGSTDTAPESSGQTPASAVRANAKLILSAQLSLQTQEFNKTVDFIETLIAQKGGYIEGSETYGEMGMREMQYSVRVPQAAFEDFLQQVGDSCHVVRSTQAAEDIADQYTDLEIHLSTLQTKHARLLSLLENAQQMEDIISLENALSETAYEIDRLSGEKRRYDSLVGFATISIDLTETQILSSVSQDATFGARLQKAAAVGWNDFKGLAQGLILGVLSAWPMLLIAHLVMLFIVCRLRRIRKKKALPPKPPIGTPSAPPVPPVAAQQQAPQDAEDAGEEQ